MHMGSVSVSPLQELRNWFSSGRATSAAPVWVHWRSCTTKHDWRETVCIDQHKSRHSNRFRMVEWADTTTLSELRCRNAYATILLFWPRISSCSLTQMLRRSRHLSGLPTFATWFSTAMYLDFGDLTCLPSMGKKFGMNSWTSWMRESEKTTSGWIPSYSATSRRLTTLIAWMSCEKVSTYHKCIKIVQRHFTHCSSSHFISSWQASRNVFEKVNITVVIRYDVAFQEIQSSSY